MLLEVPKHANSTFGSRIEKKLLPLPPTTVRYNLTGLELFKLYCEALPGGDGGTRSEEHTSELQSLMRISYAVFCLKKKNKHTLQRQTTQKSHTDKTHSIHLTTSTIVTTSDKRSI